MTIRSFSTIITTADKVGRFPVNRYCRKDSHEEDPHPVCNASGLSAHAWAGDLFETAVSAGSLTVLALVDEAFARSPKEQAASH